MIDVEFIIILILRDSAQEIDGPSTALFYLYAQFRYPRSCSYVESCKKLFAQRIKSTIESPEIRNMEVPLTDGEIIRFAAKISSLTVSYQGGEYERDVNFFGPD